MSYIDCEKCIHYQICCGYTSKEAIAESNRAMNNGESLLCFMYAPTADVVEVCRCKDCAHYHEMKGFDYKGRKAHHCVWHSALRGENDYCSDGIRRAENGERNERKV